MNAVPHRSVSPLASQAVPGTPLRRLLENGAERELQADLFALVRLADHAGPDGLVRNARGNDRLTYRDVAAMLGYEPGIGQKSGRDRGAKRAERTIDRILRAQQTRKDGPRPTSNTYLELRSRERQSFQLRVLEPWLWTGDGPPRVSDDFEIAPMQLATLPRKAGQEAEPPLPPAAGQKRSNRLPRNQGQSTSKSRNDRSLHTAAPKRGAETELVLPHHGLVTTKPSLTKTNGGIGVVCPDLWGRETAPSNGSEREFAKRESLTTTADSPTSEPSHADHFVGAVFPNDHGGAPPTTEENHADHVVQTVFTGDEGAPLDQERPPHAPHSLEACGPDDWDQPHPSVSEKRTRACQVLEGLDVPAELVEAALHRTWIDGGSSSRPGWIERDYPIAFLRVLQSLVGDSPVRKRLHERELEVFWEGEVVERRPPTDRVALASDPETRKSSRERRTTVEAQPTENQHRLASLNPELFEAFRTTAAKLRRDPTVGPVVDDALEDVCRSVLRSSDHGRSIESPGGYLRRTAERFAKQRA